MSGHCAIKEFIESTDNMVVSLHDARYGGGIIAAISYIDQVTKVIESFEDTGGELDVQLWGMMDSWYPYAHGEDINDALNLLRAKLVDNRDHWPAIRFGIIQVASESPPVHHRKTCKVITLAELENAFAVWNTATRNDPVIPFF